MSYSLVKEIVSLLEIFEGEEVPSSRHNLNGFLSWLQQRRPHLVQMEEPNLADKHQGRSADGVINTSLVHLYRYAKLYAKEAISGSAFSTPDEMFYLLSLANNGAMTKSTLIKDNVHEKSAGIQIINRLISAGFVIQEANEKDKRSRLIQLTAQGQIAIDNSLNEMRVASKLVTEPLTAIEKAELIRLLLKLEDFHEGKFRV
ncbi:MarR family winged helix-turn-helix transcriptional regulator [Pedobacter sp. SL55]|uniref:MarR family winged helix-turn-helix transcriptional regulator n=1 Tax=Pedobacter sp. SL55 TaxID=2995161 RepID=UPI00227218E1|nr:MarR family winged helix-turn-helix transcriptional regulator [Pedobacter sp. SL55]WAC42513.1 MarR family winged helix-turn-helix transcriptional regulator [Pedobacter sp. SL55]